MTRVAVGLGSNLSSTWGDRLAHLRRAREELARLAPVHATSSVWETDAIGPAQPRYLNAVVLVEWDGALLDGLLSALLEIEQGMGRVRRERWGPRTIDLDILLAEHVALATDRLTVPHPGLADRAFALAPLLEVWSEARHPTTLARYADLRVDRAGVVRTELALD